MASTVAVREYLGTRLASETKEAVLRLIFAYLAHGPNYDWTSDEDNVIIEEFWPKTRPFVFYVSGPGNNDLEDAWTSTIDFICKHEFMKDVLDRAESDSEEDLTEQLGPGVFETVPDLLQDLDNPGEERFWAGYLVLNRTEGQGLTSQHRMDLMFHFTASALLRGLRDIAGKKDHLDRAELEAFDFWA